MAELTGGYHIPLNQFANVTEMINTVALKQMGNIKVELYEQELIDNHRYGRGLNIMFNIILGRKNDEIKFKDTGLLSVPPSRFQVMDVNVDCDIKG